MAKIRNATLEDYDLVFNYIEKLWARNTYQKDDIFKVYKEVLENEDNFAFLLFVDDEAVGFCHGAYFNTFWLSGQTCYVSSIITNENVRRKGYAHMLMDHAKSLAKNRGCKGIILDSAMFRTDAHAFYEKYGFEKCAHCYNLLLK